MRAGILSLVILLACANTAAVSAEKPYCGTAAHRNTDGAIDARFMGIDMTMVAHRYAELLCDSPRRSLVKRIQSISRSRGCGPGTEIYEALVASARKMEAADLVSLLGMQHERKRLSKAQIRLGAQSVLDQLGGCKSLRAFHDMKDK